MKFRQTKQNNYSKINQNKNKDTSKQNYQQLRNAESWRNIFSLGVLHVFISSVVCGDEEAQVPSHVSEERGQLVGIRSLFLPFGDQSQITMFLSKCPYL